MRSVYTAAVAAALLAPAVARAQPTFGRTPYAFAGPVRTYHVFGCGDGPLSITPDSPSTTLFCLDGTLSVGPTIPLGGRQPFQAVLDLYGSRLHGFAGTFFDVDYSSFQFSETVRRSDGSVFTEGESLGPALDPTGHTTFGYFLSLPAFAPVEPGQPTIPADGVLFEPVGRALLGYVPQDAPGGPFYYGRDLAFSLSVTPVPEPATLALTFGGLMLVGGIAAARRRGTA